MLALPRLGLLDGEKTKLADVELAIRELQRRYPGQPIMMAVDYVQIMAAEQGPRDLRQQISSVVESLRQLVARHEVVGLMISQMSRSSSRQVRAGELVGKDAADTGAESAAIERSAAITLTIGQLGESDADGWRDVMLSRGKGRYGGGDTVFTLRQRGASGTTFVKSEESGHVVREARANRREVAKKQQVQQAVLDSLRSATCALSKAEIRSALGKNRGDCNAAIDALVARGELVEVPSGPEHPRARYPRYQVRDRTNGEPWPAQPASANGLAS